MWLVGHTHSNTSPGYQKSAWQRSASSQGHSRRTEGHYRRTLEKDTTEEADSKDYTDELQDNFHTFLNMIVQQISAGNSPWKGHPNMNRQ